MISVSIKMYFFLKNGYQHDFWKENFISRLPVVLKTGPDQEPV